MALVALGRPAERHLGNAAISADHASIDRKGDPGVAYSVFGIRKLLHTFVRDLGIFGAL